jgi:hypothetical protein
LQHLKPHGRRRHALLLPWIGRDEQAQVVTHRKRLRGGTQQCKVPAMRRIERTPKHNQRSHMQHLHSRSLLVFDGSVNDSASVEGGLARRMHTCDELHLHSTGCKLRAELTRLKQASRAQ